VAACSDGTGATPPRQRQRRRWRWLPGQDEVAQQWRCHSLVVRWIFLEFLEETGGAEAGAGTCVGAPPQPPPWRRCRRCKTFAPSPPPPATAVVGACGDRSGGGGKARVMARGRAPPDSPPPRHQPLMDGLTACYPRTRRRPGVGGGSGAPAASTTAPNLRVPLSVCQINHSDRDGGVNSRNYLSYYIMMYMYIHRS
jgi:hypothetical protein